MRSKAKAEETLQLSPSAIELLNKCEAGFIYSRCVLPKMRTESIEKLTGFGSSFHEAAEQGFNEDVLEVMEHMGRIGTKEREEILSMRDFIDRVPIFEGVENVEREVEISCEVNNGTLYGIIDYIGHRSDGTVVVADWKSSSFVLSTARDTRQLLTYAYMLNKAYGTEPDKITLALVYPRAGEFRTIECDNETLKRHERYIVNMFRKAQKLIQQYNEHQQMKKFVHVVGDCGVCPMKGRCIAYRVVASPADADEDVLTTDSLIDEYFTKREILKVLEERVDAIEEALLQRLDPDCPYSSEEDRTKILDHMVVSRRSSTVVSLNDYVDRAIVPALGKMLRSDPLVGVNIDLGGVSAVLKAKIKQILGKDVIDAKRVEKDISLPTERREGKPFLRPR